MFGKHSDTEIYNSHTVNSIDIEYSIVNLKSNEQGKEIADAFILYVSGLKTMEEVNNCSWDRKGCALSICSNQSYSADANICMSGELELAVKGECFEEIDGYFTIEDTEECIAEFLCKYPDYKKHFILERMSLQVENRATAYYKNRDEEDDFISTERTDSSDYIFSKTDMDRLQDLISKIKENPKDESVRETIYNNQKMWANLDDIEEEIER